MESGTSITYKMKNFFKRHWLLASLLISLLLHGVFFVSSGVYFYLQNLLLSTVPEQQPLAQPPEQRSPLEFTFVETPNQITNPVPTDKPKYISDKSAAAQDQATDKSLPVGEAFSDGLASFAQLAEKPGGVEQAEAEHERDGKTAGSKEKPEKTETPLFKRPKPANNFSRELLTGGRRQKQQRTGYQGELEREAMRNMASRAINSGAFSLSTYDWDFAPYLLKLKRTIERKNNPPAAFRNLGLIDGKTSLVFRIMPDGRLEGLKVLDTVGHESLMTTAVYAVRASAPFAPLPENFPEDYLEVRVRFEYLINR